MKRWNRLDNRKGFTLVEMVVVLMIMSIMLAATAWGVTGWIKHFTYVRNEETARYIYLGAQSGLSAYESRGSLQELMDEIEKQALSIQSTAPDPEAEGRRVFQVGDADRSSYGIPDKKDLHEKEHTYVTLRADRDQLREAGDENRLLYSIIGPYLSDAETLNGSVSVEFDVTAGKVYSVFYSGWASRFQYAKDNADTAERGLYEINALSREAGMRSDYCIGYYDADQINVADIEAAEEPLEVEAMLFNEETLHLDFHTKSDLPNIEDYVDYVIDFYTYRNMDDTPKKAFSIAFNAKKVLGNIDMVKEGMGPGGVSVYKTVEKPLAPRTKLKVTEYRDSGEGESASIKGEYTFYMGYAESKNMESDDGKKDIVLVLDQQTDSLSLAQMEDRDEKGRADTDSLSITRFLGDEAMLLYADVHASIAPGAAGALTGSGTKRSNTENDLFATDYKNESHVKGEETVTGQSFQLTNNRHLYNVRFAEKRKARVKEERDKEYLYTLKDDLYFVQSEIYQIRGTGYEKASDADKVFATLPVIGEKSMLDGDGHSIFGLRMNNSSYVEYPRDDATGNIILGTDVDNTVTRLGMVGENKGFIRRLVLSDAHMEALTKAEAKEKASLSGFPVCSDKLQAVGILTGRDYGSMQEIYLDDKCELTATIFQKATPDKETGCGIGMLAGTMQLTGAESDSADAVQMHDRLRSGGTVTANLTASGDGEFKKVTAAVGTDERNAVFEQIVPADYAYGIGGCYGYVYGNFKDIQTITKQPAVGLSEEKIKERADNNKYKSGISLKVGDSANKGSETIKQEDVFADWIWSLENRAVVNKDNEEDGVFTGGIVGNIETELRDDLNLKDVLPVRDPVENDIRIPTEYLAPQIIGCRNYGGVYGEDFVGGIVGVNGLNGYIKQCVSYSNMKATDGVSGGITAENFGYIQESRVDRNQKDDLQPDGYVPEIRGNVTVAGTIACINHSEAVLKDCSCGLSSDESIGLSGQDQKIMIVGNEMRTLGYLVGMNYGVVDGGVAGSHLGYETQKEGIIIGGAVGINYPEAVVKHIESAMQLTLTNAERVGGVVGQNNGCIKYCIFSGGIEQDTNGRNTAKIRIGGITAVNEREKGQAAADVPTVENCYLIGATLQLKGIGAFTEDMTQEKKIESCSAIGGICGQNNTDCLIQNCYASAHFAKNSLGEYAVQRSSSLTARNGMAGGIAAINSGQLLHCGYTARKLALQEDGDDLNTASALSADAGQDLDAEGSTANRKDMEFADTAIQYMKTAAGADTDDDAAEAAEALRRMFMKGATGELNETAAQYCGYLDSNPDAGINAYPKVDEGGVFGKTYDYENSGNTYLISMQNGKGYVGGIAAFNTSGGTIEECSTGRWVVEYYLPTETYGAIGGVVGENAARAGYDAAKGDGSFRFNANLAYVRREMHYVDGSYAGSERDKHAFSYVGGVIGMQKNESKAGWTLEGCLNAGSVVYLYGNNAGGIIAKMMKNGGNVRHCYNYGMIMTGFTDDSNKYRGYVGTCGGIVAHMSNLDVDQGINIKSCQNHSVIDLPVIGIVRKTHRITDAQKARYMANEVGGLIGELSSPKNDRYYSLNVEDCVNGSGGEIFSHSVIGGMVGRIGGYSSYTENANVAELVNNVAVSIKGCRNYSDSMWIVDNNCKNGDLAKLTVKVAGIFSARPPIKGNASIEGYTAIQECLSVRLDDFNGGGGTDYTTNMGKVLSNHFEAGDSSLKYYVDNYYIDNFSFQYLSNNYDSVRNKKNLVDPVRDNKDVSKVIPRVAGSKEDSSQTKEIRSYNVAPSYGGADNVIKPARLYAIAYGDDTHYALVNEESKNILGTCTPDNSWLDRSGGWDVLMGLDSNMEETQIGPVVSYFEEAGVDGHVYNQTSNMGHFQFKNQVLSGVLSKSRLPLADEFDLDEEGWYKLDRDYVKYIQWRRENRGYDRIVKLNVTKDEDNARYRVRWEPSPIPPNTQATATEYKMTIAFYEMAMEADFAVDNLSAYELVKEVDQTAYSTTTTFTVPEDLVMKDRKKYYAVVTVKDARDESGAGMSDVTDTTDGIKSYVPLDPQLPIPDFEIVSYEGKWYLHLKKKSADKYEAFTKEPFSELKIGVYQTNDKGEKVADSEVYLSGKDLVFGDPDDLELLYNAKLIDNTKLQNDKKDQVLTVYASATGALTSKPAEMTVFIPKECYPAKMQFSISQMTEAQKASMMTTKPEYSGKLFYTVYDGSQEPDLEQVFRLELYGIKKNSDGKEYHETVAWKEYSLRVGETAQINIGYYDAPSGVSKEYDNFGVDCWYASTGQGEVNHYFTTSKGHAFEKKRLSGFITVKNSDDTADDEYLFHARKLPVPEFEIVRIKREGKFLARLLRPEDYEDIPDSVTLYENNNAFKMQQDSFGSPFTLYGAIIDVPHKSRNQKKTVAASAGMIPSEYIFDVSPYAMLKKDINGWQNYICFDRIENESMTVTAEGNLEFTGQLIASAHKTSENAQYFTTEVYAKDENEQDVTIYLQTDRILDQNKGNWTFGSYDIGVTLTDENTGLDLSRYHDFRLTCWYSSQTYPGNENSPLKNYFAVDESVMGNQARTRENGILTFIGKSYTAKGNEVTGGSPESPLYFFAAPLYDAEAFYGTPHKTGNDATDNPLRIESTKQIAKVTNLRETEDETDPNRLLWTASSEISDQNQYDLKLQYLKVPKSDETATDISQLTVSGNSIIKEVKETVTGTEYVHEDLDTVLGEAGETKEYATYDYYLYARVVDHNVQAPEDSEIYLNLSTEALIPLLEETEALSPEGESEDLGSPEGYYPDPMQSDDPKKYLLGGLP